MKFEPIQLSPFFHFNFEATGGILPAMTVTRDSTALYYDKMAWLNQHQYTYLALSLIRKT